MAILNERPHSMSILATDDCHMGVLSTTSYDQILRDIREEQFYQEI
jgi:hypothetical protein